MPASQSAYWSLKEEGGKIPTLPHPPPGGSHTFPISHSSFGFRREPELWYTLSRMPQVRSVVHSVGRGFPEAGCSLPQGQTRELRAVPMKASYPDSSGKILALKETLYKGSRWERTVEKELRGTPSAQLPPLFTLPRSSLTLFLQDSGIRPPTIFALLTICKPPPHPFRKLSNHRDKPFKRWARLQFVEQLSDNTGLQACGTQKLKVKTFGISQIPLPWLLTLPRSRESTERKQGIF